MRRKENPWLGMLRGLLLSAIAAAALVMFAAALDGLPSLDWDLVPRTSLIQEFIDRK